ncbi:ribonuclease M5 [Desulfonema ishimotonii]|uniref:Ribonuclease M5 n=1 Tax=Desulfonema ishimotonii TaxID=45657 RepID=A0A401FYB2_9BACT|nr:ribonuclease M5 [Desulfonema ishimotonii]GBC61945.1 ribonuclease M5 [Desulfonema ishimotonii]
MKIREVIVVEGRDDVRAVKQAVDAEMITTSGFGITRETFRRIAFAQEKKGVIIFTDPDHAGEQIRKRINRRVRGCKNAYLIQEDAIRKDNIGIENARPESIRRALKQAKCITETAEPVFTGRDLMKHDLTGSSHAAERRKVMGKILGIGYANGKQWLRRLNHYGISRAQFDTALGELADAGE